MECWQDGGAAIRRATQAVDAGDSSQEQEDLIIEEVPTAAAELVFVIERIEPSKR